MPSGQPTAPISRADLAREGPRRPSEVARGGRPRSIRSSRRFVAEHRQPAARLLARGLVLNDVPVLREHAILHPNDVGDDPRRWQAVTAEPPVENDEVTRRRGDVVL